MQLAKAVANAAAALVLKAKNVAQKTGDSVLQNRVIAAATQCALSTSQLVACTKVSVWNKCPISFRLFCSIAFLEEVKFFSSASIVEVYITNL